MVGADGASPQPTTPLAASTRTSRFSALSMVMPAIFIGLRSGSATAIASMRRRISGSDRAAVSGARRVRSSIVAPARSAGRLDVRRLDDRRPLLDLGLVEGAEARRCLLVARGKLLADVL